VDGLLLGESPSHVNIDFSLPCAGLGPAGAVQPISPMGDYLIFLVLEGQFYHALVLMCKLPKICDHLSNAIPSYSLDKIVNID